MKIALQIKLLPDKEQEQYLLDTLQEANKACNYISETAFKTKTYYKYKLHKEVYAAVKSAYNLSSQNIIRCIAKVSDSYKKDKKKQRTYKPYGSIAYDSRILSYKQGNIISIWTTGGRIKIPVTTYKPEYLSYNRGEADLQYKKGKFYLLQTIEIPSTEAAKASNYIGVDLGQRAIAVLCDGQQYASKEVQRIRRHYCKIRAGIQQKGTRSARKLLKKISGKERRFVSITNHTIAKQIIEKAKSQNKGIAIEDLKKIRQRAKVKTKAQRQELNRWSFLQLRRYITYKAEAQGIDVQVVNPAYTSKTCNKCMHIGIRNKKNFKCTNCGNIADADVNAAQNIAYRGYVNSHERWDLLCCNIHNGSMSKALHL